MKMKIIRIAWKIYSKQFEVEKEKIAKKERKKENQERKQRKIKRAKGRG